ncbi:MAG: hypothetical protein AB7C98_10600 [Acidithiobacillus sp.]
MDTNWIIENLENAFATWNSKLAEIWGLLSTSPQNFKGGGVWNAMVGINGALTAIGYGLLVLFLAMGIFGSTLNFRDFKRPEQALRFFIRFVAAKAAVTYGMELMTAFFDICLGVVNARQTGQANAEFAAAIQGIIDDNNDVDGVVYDFFGCASSTVPNNWTDIVAVFAVKTNMDSETGMDVVTMDAGRVDLIKAVFWNMNQLDHWVECILADNEDEEDTYILHIEITGRTAAEMAAEYGFDDEQREVLDTFLAPEYVELLRQLMV